MPRAAIAFSRCATARVARRHRHQSGPGAVRHRAGRRASGAARGERRGRPSRSASRRYAIGGLSVGEPPAVMYEVVSRTTPCLPDGSPALPDGRRHAGRHRGGGRARHRPLRLRAADAQRPERPAVHQRRAGINIKNARYAEDDGPLDPACGCYTCRHLLARLSHGISSRPARSTRPPLTRCITCTFTLTPFGRIREAIAFGRFESFRVAFHQSLSRRSRPTTNS